MLILIYSEENKESEYVLQKISKSQNYDILEQNDENVQNYLYHDKGILILKDFSKWEYYKNHNVLLLIIFTDQSKNNSNFYENIVDLNKFSYKIRYLNAFKNLDDQINKMNFEIRPSWEKYFMDLAIFASYRSSCKKRNVGAILVKDKRIISTGFNGTPVNTLNCIDGGCPRCNGDSKIGENLDLCFCLHAEESAIIGQSKELTTNATMYVTLFPCVLCMKKIIQAGIKEIVYKDSYIAKDESLIKTCQAQIKIRKI